jgi:hypothetical protein
MGFFSNIKDAKKKKDSRLGGIMNELKSIRGGQKKVKPMPKKKAMK